MRFYSMSLDVSIATIRAWSPASMNLRRLSHFDKQRACSVGVGRSPTHGGRCKVSMATPRRREVTRSPSCEARGVTLGKPLDCAYARRSR